MAAEQFELQFRYSEARVLVSSLQSTATVRTFTIWS